MTALAVAVSDSSPRVRASGGAPRGSFSRCEGRGSSGGRHGGEPGAAERGAGEGRAWHREGGDAEPSMDVRAGVCELRGRGQMTAGLVLFVV